MRRLFRRIKKIRLFVCRNSNWKSKICRIRLWRCKGVFSRRRRRGIRFPKTTFNTRHKFRKRRIRWMMTGNCQMLKDWLCKISLTLLRSMREMISSMRSASSTKRQTVTLKDSDPRYKRMSMIWKLLRSSILKFNRNARSSQEIYRRN